MGLKFHTHWDESNRKPSRREDDYMVRDPETNEQITSPLKLLDENPSLEHLDQSLYVLKEEFLMNNTPYEKRDKDEQNKINKLLLMKAKDIKQYAKLRAISKPNHYFNLK